MTLQDDMRWLLDGADSLLAGALPLWPRKWSTKSCERLATILGQMHRRYFEAATERNALEAKIRILEDNVSGLRDTNAKLTNMLERTEQRLSGLIAELDAEGGET